MPFIFVAMLPMIFAPAFGQENEGLMIVGYLALIIGFM